MHLSTLPILALCLMGNVAAMTLTELLTTENTTLSALNSLLSKQPALLSSLTSAQNITILAPSNAAFIELLATPDGQTVADSLDLAAALLQYHVLPQILPASSFTTDPQFHTTFLTNTSFARVTGGQVLESVKTSTGKLKILTGLKESSEVQIADLAFTGGVLHIIDTVLTVPITPSFTTLDSNLTALAGALTAADLITTLDDLTDVTIFAPSNAAFQAIGSATASLTTQQLSSILTYHVINNTVGYSTLLNQDLANQTFPTVSGGEVNILVESGKVFVNSAQVIITDIIVSNGVMHVLDNVLNPANTTVLPDPNAKTQAAAFADATPAATVPFTMGIVPTTTAPSASTNTNAAPKRGGIGIAALFGAGVVGMAVL